MDMLYVYVQQGLLDMAELTNWTHSLLQPSAAAAFGAASAKGFAREAIFWSPLMWVHGRFVHPSAGREYHSGTDSCLSGGTAAALASFDGPPCSTPFTQVSTYLLELHK